jgi:hypothetical protein
VGTLALTQVGLRCTPGKSAAQWAGAGPMGRQGEMGWSLSGLRRKRKGRRNAGPGQQASEKMAQTGFTL